MLRDRAGNGFGAARSSHRCTIRADDRGRFSLPYDLDTPLMKPGAVLALEPEVDFLLYQ